jgi:hypothetical protein
MIPALIFTSCFKIKKVGSGNVVNDNRLLETCTRVECDLPTDVYWHYSTESKVVVITDDNLLSSINTSVNGNKLRITLKSSIRRIDPTSLEVHIYNDNIKEYEVNGSGTFTTSDTLYNNEFSCKINGSGEANLLYVGEEINAIINGSGEMVLSGAAIDGLYDINGSGKIIGTKMLLNNATATIDGSGRIYVNVTGLLKIYINGSGDVYYKGNPQLNININGSGSIHEF